MNLRAGQSQSFELSSFRIFDQKADSPLVSRADSSTQQIIDNAVLTGLEGSTVLYVAHRLEILTQFDRVMVMDQGRIVEFGDPRTLLQNPDSLFASTFNKANSQISSLNAK